MLSHNGPARKGHRQGLGHRSKKPCLPRPKYGTTYTIPEHLFTPSDAATVRKQQQKTRPSDVKGRPRASTPDLNPVSGKLGPPSLRLSRISVLLNAVHRRNKNQHRNQHFYRHLQVLRRTISRLARLHQRSRAFSQPTPTNVASPEPVTAASVRRNFEAEAQLRSQRDVLEDHIRERIVPAAYVAFSTVVADTQFANLGVVLFGILADVVSVVGGMRTIQQETTQPSKAGLATTSGQDMRGEVLFGVSVLRTGPEQGTVVERVYDRDHVTGFSNNPNTPGRDGLAIDRDSDFGEVVPRGDSEAMIVGLPKDIPAVKSRTLGVLAQKMEERERSDVEESSRPCSRWATETPQSSSNENVAVPAASELQANVQLGHNITNIRYDETRPEIAVMTRTHTSVLEAGTVSFRSTLTAAGTGSSSSEVQLQNMLQSPSQDDPQSTPVLTPVSRVPARQEPFADDHSDNPNRNKNRSDHSARHGQNQARDEDRNEDRNNRPTPLKKSSKKSSKKKTKANAIDDLFSGFT